MTMFLKRHDLEMDGKFGTLILEPSINMEASTGAVICLTHYSARHLGALERLPDGLH